jgi:hypothetical protein
MAMKTRRPPNLSAAMPAGKRQMAPFKTATATTHANCKSVSPNSSRIGMPSTPNMSQTANIKVKPKVDITKTLTLPVGASSSFIYRIKAHLLIYTRFY